MNHSTRVEDLSYARSNFSFSNIRSSLQFKYLEFCLRYFRFFKIDESNLSLNPFISSIRAKYSQIEEEKLSIANSSAIKFSKPSTLKHRRQESSISSSLQNDLVLKKTKTKDLVHLSSLTSSSSLLLDPLREFLGDPQAVFRIQEQEDLIRAILTKVPYIIGILPTSSGKSLTYLLTSSLRMSNKTIVVVPLVGLKLDLLRRAKEFNIPCSIFEDNQEITTLTLVSIESILSSSFISLVTKLINNKEVDRFIFDECHLIVTAKDYRNIIYRVKQALILFPI